MGVWHWNGCSSSKLRARLSSELTAVCSAFTGHLQTFSMAREEHDTTQHTSIKKRKILTKHRYIAWSSVTRPSWQKENESQARRG